MTPTRSTTRGFTLMELLIVIMIIGVLAGLLFPAVMIAKEAGRKGKTRATIANIASAVEQFKTLNGAYPKSSRPDDPTSPTRTIYFPEDLASVNASAFGPNGANVVSEVIRIGSEDVQVPTAVTDAWGHDIIYRPFMEYNYTTPSDQPVDADSDPAPNPDSFQIWSIGPDDINDLGLGDDINNWTN